MCRPLRGLVGKLGDLTFLGLTPQAILCRPLRGLYAEVGRSHNWAHAPG